MRIPFLAALLSAVLLSPAGLWACACGCGVFDVQTGAMMPNRAGGTAFLEYDYVDQSRNWSGGSKAPSADNADKSLRTLFITAGAQYMFDRSWGFMAELPFWDRRMDMVDGGMPMSLRHGGVGDLRLRGLYTGFSGNMASGLSFGAKLPTGGWSYPGLDRDSQIGTGSTDLLLGAFTRAAADGGDWAGFASVLWDDPFLSAGGYRPGAELNAAAGAYFDGWRPGGLVAAPMLQLTGSLRGRDGGPAGDPDNTGYRRLLVAPGFELSGGGWRVNADVGLPVYQFAHGDQLVASAYYKLRVGYGF